MRRNRGPPRPQPVRTSGGAESRRAPTPRHTRGHFVCAQARSHPAATRPCAPPRRLSAGYATRRRMQRHDTLHRYARFHPHHPLNQTPSSLVLISRARRCSLQVLPVLLGSARTHARDGDRSVQASLPGLRGRERDRVREMRRHGTVHRRRVCTHSIGTLCLSHSHRPSQPPRPTRRPYPDVDAALSHHPSRGRRARSARGRAYGPEILCGLLVPLVVRFPDR